MKNTDSNSLNFMRVFADFRTGREDQTALAKFNNPALSFSNAIQTINLDTNMPGLSQSNRFANSLQGIFRVQDQHGKEKNLAAGWLDSYGHSFRGAKNFIYAVPYLDSVNVIRRAEKKSSCSY